MPCLSRLPHRYAEPGGVTIAIGHRVEDALLKEGLLEGLSMVRRHAGVVPRSQILGGRNQVVPKVGAGGMLGIQHGGPIEVGHAALVGILERGSVACRPRGKWQQERWQQGAHHVMAASVARCFYLLLSLKTPI